MLLFFGFMNPLARRKRTMKGVDPSVMLMRSGANTLWTA